MADNLKIVHTESSCGWGGQELRVLTEAKGFSDRGHEVTLLCPEEAPIYVAGQDMGLNTLALPIARKNVKGLLALRRWFKGRAIDVLNTHSSTDSWLSAVACQTLSSKPLIVRTRHVSTPIQRNLTTRWLYNRATAHIVTAGEALRQQLHQENQFALDHMTSVPTGIDLDYFNPLDRQQMKAELGLAADYYVGILATLRNWKGHQYLLDAFNALAEDYPQWGMIIVGDGPQRKNLEKRIRELGLNERVQMVGNRDDVPRWLSAMDVFALPSYGSEGVPQSVMQAMACGLPVVSTTVGAISEAMVDSETGYLIPPKDVTALEQKLRVLLSNSELRLQMGAAGRVRAQQFFGLDNMLDGMSRVFRKALGTVVS